MRSRESFCPSLDQNSKKTNLLNGKVIKKGPLVEVLLCRSLQPDITCERCISGGTMSVVGGKVNENVRERKVVERNEKQEKCKKEVLTIKFFGE